jgi:glycine/D-amino acid oxidase-like deaminating enzyme
MGVAKFENTTALSTLRRGDEVLGVRTVRGDVHAAGVVWATGAWSTNLATEGLLLPVVTARTGHMSTQPNAMRGHAVLHGPRGVAMCGALSDLPTYRSELFTAPPTPAGSLVDYDDVIARTNEGGLYVGSTIDGVGSMNPHISIAATQAMTAATLERYPESSELGVTGLWAGLTVETSDGLPIVDRVDGVYVNTGHRWGVASGPVCGELTAQLIAGEPTALGPALHVDRPGLVAQS